MQRTITPFVCLFLLLHTSAALAQSKSKKPTVKQSVNAVKQDFQNLKDVFRKKDKGVDTAADTQVIAGNTVTQKQGVQIATGNYHVLALKDGTLYGWGDNTEGQLGLGSKSIEYSPRQIGNPNEWKQADAAAMHSLAIKKDGSLWAWGWGNNHEMGLGQQVSRSLVPTRVGRDTNWVMVSTAPNNTVALKRDGSLWVWGSNVSAALGVGATTNSAVYVPTRVGLDADWESAVAVQHVLLAIKKNGTLWSWGRRGGSDVRGLNTMENVSPAPVQVGTDSDRSTLFVHRPHGTAAVIGTKKDGSLWVWGSNRSGKLGIGTELFRQEPAPLRLEGKWKMFGIGPDYSLAVRDDGSLWHSGSYLKWTDARMGQTNSSTTFQRSRIAGKWTAVHLLQNSGVVLVNEQGDVYAYGINARGELGQGTKSGSWVPLPVKF